MQKALIRSHLRNALADDAQVMTDIELNQIIDLAIYQYSIMRPSVEEFALTTTTGTLTYALDSDVIGVLSVVNASLTEVAYTRIGQLIRFTTDPGTGAYVVSAMVLHTETSGDYPTIPAYDLGVVVDIANYIVLERIADDIARRPDIQDGQTRESWRDSAQVLYNRAAVLRNRVLETANDELVFVG